MANALIDAGSVPGELTSALSAIGGVPAENMHDFARLFDFWRRQSFRKCALE